MSMFSTKPSNTSTPLEVPSLSKQRDFTLDITPLMFMLKHELTKAINIMSGEELNVNIIREDFIRKICSDISNNIIHGLAPTYMDVLKLYFTEDLIISFIAENVTQELINKGLVVNRKVFNTNSADEPTIHKDSLPNVEAASDMG